jgi:hypothetical protein
MSEPGGQAVIETIPDRISLSGTVISRAGRDLEISVPAASSETGLPSPGTLLEVTADGALYLGVAGVPRGTTLPVRIEHVVHLTDIERLRTNWNTGHS